MEDDIDLFAADAAALRAAMGSTLFDVDPLMRCTVIEPPGGRRRAYLARRASMPDGRGGLDDDVAFDEVASTAPWGAEE